MVSEVGLSGATACVVALLIAGFGSWLWWYRQAQRKRPGPKAWPVIGNLLDLVPNWERLHEWMLEQFSGTKTFHLRFPFTVGGVFTVDPACVEHILKTNFVNYPKGPNNNKPLQDLFGDGIFTADGHSWKEQRRLSSYEFSSATLRDFSTGVFREYAMKFVLILARNARTAEAFDLQDLCMRLTLDTTCKVGFGFGLDCLSPAMLSVPFAKAFDDANFISFHRYVDPLWKVKRMVSIGTERKLKECLKLLDDFTYKVISSRRREMASSTKQRSDLLSRFMGMTKWDGEGFTDTNLRDIVLNFIIAGRDTTAGTLAWFFYMLTCHPEVADKIVDELSTITQHTPQQSQEFTEETVQEFAKLLTFETLGKLSYLHAALSETLRLYPSVAVDSKEAAGDDVLPDGTIVKKGTIVGYVPYSMGRMTFLWGNDAREFKPERWLKDGQFQPEPLFKFTAFQAGPRTCIGKDSSYLQMKMMAALALRFFTFHLVPGHPIEYRTMLTLSMIHGLQVTVTPR